VAASIGLDPAKFGTHSLRRTNAVLIYRRTGNLRAVQLLLGHSKAGSTALYLGIEGDDAIEIVEKTETRREARVRRREFIGLLGGAAAGLAQQPGSGMLSAAEHPCISSERARGL
jgi:hypothetical protein